MYELVDATVIPDYTKSREVFHPSRFVIELKRTHANMYGELIPVGGEILFHF